MVLLAGMGASMIHGSKYDIPFNRAALQGNELRYMAEAIRGGHISANGPFTRRCSELLETMLDAHRVLLTTSGTAALEMCALLQDLRPGDEVIIPSFGFVTTAGAFAMKGARLVFADIRRDTLNLDEADVQRKISDRTRAVVALHYSGIACQMDPLLALARDRGIQLIEDNAHGLFGQYRGQRLGTLGNLGVLSFHETKNVTCGEGGALVVNDRQLLERAEIIWEKGTDRARFRQGAVDRYTWVDFGSSYAISDLLAAFLLAQLEQSERSQNRREQIWRRYDRELLDWSVANAIRMPEIPEHCRPAYHLYYLIMASARQRDRFIAHLREHRILAVFHYGPLHLSTMGRRYAGRPGDCPVAEETADRIVRLPMFNSMTDDEQDAVIDAALRYRR